MGALGLTSAPFILAMKRSLFILVALCSCAAPAQRQASVETCLAGADVSEVRRRLTESWRKAFDGEPPTDVDLGAYQDAVEILECVEATTSSAAVGPSH